MAKHSQDRTIAVWNAAGGWTLVNEPRQPASYNFLIVCKYGDWSGFRSLAGCLSQSMENNDSQYKVVER